MFEVSIRVEEVFPDRAASEDDLVALLRPMKRDDVLLQCAYANSVISGFGLTDDDARQATAIKALCAPSDIVRIQTLSRRSGRRVPNIFFRGQLLEMMRRAAQACDPAPGSGAGFDDPEARSRFLAAALIAGDLWSQRVYADRLSATLPPDEARRRAMGAFRKAVDEGNSPSNLGICLGRGRALFGEHMRRQLPEFDAWFLAETGLSYAQYADAAAALATYTIAGRNDGCVFNPKTVGSTTQFEAQIDAFLRLESQTAAELDRALSESFTTNGYRAIRDRPILRMSGGRAVILDPSMFYEKIAVGPLFCVVRHAANLKRGDVNRVFGAFGDAFERYADEALRRMHPTGRGLVERIKFGAKGHTANGEEFEVDALMVEPIGGSLAAIIVEAKAAFLPEYAILDDPAIFLEELRRRYGQDPDGKERDKGVAQLARIIRAILDRVWRGEDRELDSANAIIPVLLTHDTRMDSPVVGWQLNEDLVKMIGEIPFGWRVAPLIVLTIEDLENLESSVGRFTLAELFRDYHYVSPDRMISFQRFLVGSKYAALIKPSSKVRAEAEAQMDAVSKSLFPKPAAPDAA